MKIQKLETIATNLSDGQEEELREAFRKCSLRTLSASIAR